MERRQWATRLWTRWGWKWRTWGREEGYRQIRGPAWFTIVSNSLMKTGIILTSEQLSIGFVLSLDHMILECLRDTGAGLTSGFLAFDLLIPRKGLTCGDRCEAS